MSLGDMTLQNTSSFDTYSPEAPHDFNAQADKYFDKTIFTYKCSSFFKGDRDEGRVSVIWPGSATHYMKAMRYPRWEDYRYGLRRDAENNRMAWFGNGLTRAQKGEGKLSAFLDDIDVPPAINPGPRPGLESHLATTAAPVVVDGDLSAMKAVVSQLAA
ncbi:hypothetical protein E8E14_009717 [Neopestalotiopsis sp. 37M]|nr:hypothetical protein E8E14_009717 [Neopestalotiopsis sp. 37M]